MSSPGSTGIVPGVPMGPASQQYGGAADRVNQAAGGFSFTPNQNDPELNALHSRMQQSQMARFLRNRDEFARAGLLGSSQQISGSNALQDQFGNEQYSADQDIFGRQRSEQLGMYNSDLDFRRQAEMARLGLLSQEELIDFQRKYNNQDLLGGILGEAGGLAGDLTYDYFHRRGGKKTG